VVEQVRPAGRTGAPLLGELVHLLEEQVHLLEEQVHLLRKPVKTQ